MSDIKKAFDHILTQRDEYNRAIAYYDGSQPEVFQSQRWMRIFRFEGADFRFNFAKTVVDSVLNRLEVNQVQATTVAANNYINKLFDQTDIKLDMNEIHRNALVYGDCYAIVWPDSTGKVGIDYNSPTTTALIYDQENPRVKSFATKIWQVEDDNGDKFIKLNLYYVDRIEKYIGMGDLEYITNLPAMTLTEIVPNPWNEIPVFHFRAMSNYQNRPKEFMEKKEQIIISEVKNSPYI